MAGNEIITQEFIYILQYFTLSRFILHGAIVRESLLSDIVHRLWTSGLVEVAITYSYELFC